MTVTIDGTLGLTTPAATVSGLLTAATETFTATPAVTTAQSMILLTVTNGYGATNTAVRRWTNTITNQGSDITYADSATLGGSFTINTNGVYSISCIDNFTSVASLQIGINATAIANAGASNPVIATSTGANIVVQGTYAAYLAAGTVVRALGTAASGTATAYTMFSIVRVA